MPKSENQKLKTIYVAKYFMENSDENHAVTASDICDYLRDEYDIAAERHSIYRDIARLRDEFGFDIEGGQGGRYRLLSRQFEFEDLRMLAECVHAAKFISAAKAKELVETIGELCSVYQADELKQEVFLCERVKSTQRGTLNILSTIHSAMAKRLNNAPHKPQKISFKYMRHSIDDVHTMVERRGGALYVVSPYQLLINEGNYYLLAYDDKAKDMRTYRVDRMKDVRLLPELRDGEEVFAEIDMASYVQRVFSMFGGTKKRVSIRFEENLLDTAIERFGTDGDVFYRPDGNKHFVVSADVDVSDQFFAWLCLFDTRAKIISPSDVVGQMKDFLIRIASIY